MKRSFSNVQLWAFLVLSFLIFVAVALWSPRQLAFESLDALCIALAIGGLSSYRKEAWDAIKLPVHKMLSAHYVVAGIFFAMIGMGMFFGIQWMWRIYGKPDWLIDGVPVLLTRFIAVIALSLFMLTSYSRGGVVQVGVNSRPTLVTAVAFIAVLVIWRLLV